MIMRWLGILALAQTVSGSVPLDPAAQSWLRDNLKDYDTARIEPVKPPFMGFWRVNGSLFAKGKTTTYRYHCVKVNAKNSYGAYAGWSTYLLGEQDGAITFVRESPTCCFMGHLRDDPEVTKLCGTE